MTPCSAVGLLLILLVSTCCVSSAAPLSRGSSVTQPCLGEFEYCPSSGACVLFSNLCSVCGSGQYLCPDGSTCVQGAAGYLTCPNLKGTHLDWTLPLDQRVQYIVNAANQSEMISQLTNDAPAIQRLGIPAYNWLNDDEHGVMGTKSTMFPNGCSLGASWDAELLKSVGYAIGLVGQSHCTMHVAFDLNRRQCYCTICLARRRRGVFITDMCTRVTEARVKTELASPCMHRT